MPQYFGQLPKIDQQWSKITSVQAVQRSGCTVLFECGDSRLAISILAPNLIRVRFAPNGEFIPRSSWAVTLDDAEWSVVPFEVEETNAAVEITTEQIRVSIQRQNCHITCFDKGERPFAEDADIGIGWRTGSVAGWKQIQPNEHFYGFGERTGFLDKLSQRQTNWTTDALDYGSLTDEMYQAIPFFIAVRPELSYGIFLNTTFWSQFDIGADQPEVWHMETRSSEWIPPARQLIVELVGIGEQSFDDQGTVNRLLFKKYT